MQTDQLIKLRKYVTPEIVYGEGALQLAGQHALNFGATRVLLVSDTGVVAAGWTARVAASLAAANVTAVIFDAVTPNPKDHEVMAGAALYQEEHCDLILAVGGGSPMDAAKGIGVVVGNEQPILSFEGIDAIPLPGPPLIFIPTTAGSSADVSQFAIITDTRRKVKIAIISKMVIPDISLVDPETTTSMSPELTAATGMDALSHAFEAYVSTNASPLTDMAALQAVRLVRQHLVEAWHAPEAMEHRDPMMMASLMAGLAFSNASLGLVHAMAHSLGGTLDLAHGECNALLLEQVVAYNFSVAETKYRQLARAMGLRELPADTEGAATDLMGTIAALRKSLNFRQRLREMGVTREDLPRMAAHAHQDPCLATNPREADPEAIQAIFAAIYE